MSPTAFSMIRTAALPTTTPSAKAAMARASAALVTPKPTTMGCRSLVTVADLGHVAARPFQVGQLHAGGAGHRHVVDEPLGRLACQRRPRHGRCGRQQRDEPHLMRPQRRQQLGSFVGRPVDTQHGVGAGLVRLARERLGAGHDNGVRVAEQHQAHVGVLGPGGAAQRHRPREAAARRQRALHGRLEPIALTRGTPAVLILRRKGTRTMLHTRGSSRR